MDNFDMSAVGDDGQTEEKLGKFSNWKIESLISFSNFS